MKKLSPPQILFLIIFPLVYILLSLLFIFVGYYLAFSTEGNMNNDAYNKPALAVATLVFMIFCPQNYFPKAPIIAFIVGAVLLVTYKIRWNS